LLQLTEIKLTSNTIAKEIRHAFFIFFPFSSVGFFGSLSS
jgi:hypothetical protein